MKKNIFLIFTLIGVLAGCSGSGSIQNQSYSLSGYIVYENSSNARDSIKIADDKVFYVKMLPDKEPTRVMSGSFIKRRKEPGEYNITISDDKGIIKCSEIVELNSFETVKYFKVPKDKIITEIDSLQIDNKGDDGNIIVK